MRRRTSLRRAGVIAIVLILWLLVLATGGRMFSQLSALGTNDRGQFLPDSAESTQVSEIDDAFRAEGYIYAIAVFTFEEPLEAHSPALMERQIQRMPPIEGVPIFRSTPLIVSDDQLAAEMVIPVDADGALEEATARLGEQLALAVPEASAVYITGPAAFSADIITAFRGIDGLLLLVALGAVLIILIVVYRSALLPLIVLTTSLAALCAAVIVVSALARSGTILLAGQTQGILLILVVGATTNYALLYIARFAEALREHASSWEATRVALRRAWQPILASGLTVILALLVLLVSKLESNRTLGPIAAIGIAFALLASFTLLPALLAWAGRRAFWPRHVIVDLGASVPDPLRADGIWSTIARAIDTHPRRAWVLASLALVVMTLGLTQLRADGSPSSEYVLGDSPARAGLEVLTEHYPAGAGTPAIVVVDTERMIDTVTASLAVDGVDSVRIATIAGPAPITPEGIQPFAVGAGIAPAPLVVDGKVMLEVTLSHAADSRAAEETVGELRRALDAVGEDVLVGGVTAVDMDANNAARDDRALIIPLVLVAVLLILLVLLRSPVAALLVVVSVALSYAAALGVSAVVFTVGFGFSGADPTVPLFAFVFLIALGVDYNIFLMTRAREESLVHGTRVGMLRALVLTGGVITSAGLVLAATFAALGVLPLLFLLQIAFIVAFGVLLDTFLVRTILVPAAVVDLGRVSWWPRRLAP